MVGWKEVVRTLQGVLSELLTGVNDGSASHSFRCNTNRPGRTREIGECGDNGLSHQNRRLIHSPDGALGQSAGIPHER